MGCKVPFKKAEGFSRPTQPSNFVGPGPRSKAGSSHNLKIFQSNEISRISNSLIHGVCACACDNHATWCQVRGISNRDLELDRGIGSVFLVNEEVAPTVGRRRGLFQIRYLPVVTHVVHGGFLPP